MNIPALIPRMKRSRRPTACRLELEALEDRLTPAIHTWIGAAGGAWSAGANWNGGVPSSTEAGGTIIYSGGTVVEEGTLLLNNNLAGRAIPSGELQIGAAGAASGAAVVRLAQDDQINPNDTVTISNAGVLDLNGKSQSLAESIFE